MKKKNFFLSTDLNGQKYKILITQPFQISNLLEFLNYPKELSILEYNGKIKNYLMLKSEYIKQNDKLEIITIVGGG